MVTDFVGIAAIIIVIMAIVGYYLHKSNDSSGSGYNYTYTPTDMYHMWKFDQEMRDSLHYDYTKPTISGQIDVHDYCHHDHYHH